MLNDNEKKLIDILDEAKRCVKGELELDHLDGKWFAMDYRKDFEAAVPIEIIPYNLPLVTDEELKEKDIDIIKCCDECNISYVR